MRDVYIIGANAIKFGKYLDLDHRHLTKMTVDAALADAGLETSALETAHFANCLWGYYNGQHGIRGHVALRHCGIDRIPISNVEAACASGILALYGAWKDILTGLYDCTLAVGVEKLTMEDKAKQFAAFDAFVDVANSEAMAEVTAAKMEEILKQIEVPSSAGERSRFMDTYAYMALKHMIDYGTRDDDQKALAVIAAKNHNNGALNPIAQYQFTQTIEDAANDRVVSWPLTRSMCSPMGDGAACAILCSEPFLQKLPKETRSRAVRILVCEYRSGKDIASGEDSNSKQTANAAYAAAGVTPDNIDLAEVHDASAIGELIQYEDLGFCKKGKGAEFALSGATQIGGRLPVNTSGGLIARGHPLAATGLAQIFELVTQLRGEAGERQVPGAKIALAENHGGNINDEPVAVSVTILSK